MKTREEISEMAEKNCYLSDGTPSSDVKGSYIDGYTQAQQDLINELPETFDPSISAERYHIWCKHHQRAVEIDSRKIAELEAELLSHREFKKEALESLRDERAKFNEALEVIEKSYPCHNHFCAIRPGDDLVMCTCWVKKRSVFLAKHSEEKGDGK